MSHTKDDSATSSSTSELARQTELLYQYNNRQKPKHDYDTDDVESSGKTDPLDMFVLSQDTLRNTKISHELSLGWTDRPPLFPSPDAHKKKKKEGGPNHNNHNIKKANRLLKDMIKRTSIPSALRCALWTTSVMRECHQPEDDEEDEASTNANEIERIGTVGKAPAIERLYASALNVTFPNSIDAEEVSISSIPCRFGLNSNQLIDLLDNSHSRDGSPIPEAGVKSLARVLSVVHHVLGIDYCPLLPDLTALLLNYTSEAYAYHILREVLLESNRYLAVSKRQHLSYVQTTRDLVEKFYPRLTPDLVRIGVLSGKGLAVVWKRFYVNVFKYDDVLRMVDLYLIEGSKFLFRITSALLQVVEEKFHLRNIHTPEEFWNGVRDYVRSDKFDFNELLKRVYGFHGTTGVGARRLLRRRKFPNRRNLARRVRYNEDWTEDHPVNEDDDDDEVDAPPPKPMGYVTGEIEMMLAKPSSVRSSLASWLPAVYRNCHLDIIYSTNVHGRSVRQLYDKVGMTKRTVTLIEVLLDDDKDDGPSSSSFVVGMYASQPWKPRSYPYGDGECFLFRCSPDPKCFKWRPDAPGSIDGEDDHGGGRGSSGGEDAENDALLEQFMVCRDTYFSMGGNKDGSSGLRLNDDLTKGESSPAVGFHNEPLAGEDNQVFEIGTVEVFRLVREVDGKEVDFMGNSVWNYEG